MPYRDYKARVINTAIFGNLNDNSVPYNLLMGEISSMQSDLDKRVDEARDLRKQALAQHGSESAEYKSAANRADHLIKIQKKFDPKNPKATDIVREFNELKKYMRNVQNLSPLEAVTQYPNLINLYNGFILHLKYYDTYYNTVTGKHSKFVDVVAPNIATIKYYKELSEEQAKQFDEAERIVKSNDPGERAYAGQILRNLMVGATPGDIVSPNDIKEIENKKDRHLPAISFVRDEVLNWYKNYIPLEPKGEPYISTPPSKQAFLSALFQKNRTKMGLAYALDVYGRSHTDPSTNIKGAAQLLRGVGGGAHNLPDKYISPSGAIIKAAMAHKGNTYTNAWETNLRGAYGGDSTIPRGRALVPSSNLPEDTGTTIIDVTPKSDTEEKKKDKTKKGIADYLQLMYRPLINLVKGLGDIAGEAKKMELAMSSLATALGNPFEEATLGAITDFGSAGINTAIGGAGAIGSTISSVGSGVGRMANNWGHYGGDTGKAPPKGAGMVSAISAALGFVGGAISVVTSVVSAGFSISTSLLKSLNKITLKILGSSPLLETIKNILNLAFTMAFLPAMTLLEGQILPVVLDLLNTLVDFGNTFTKDFNKYIPEIVKSFGDVFKTMGDFFSNNSQSLADLISGMIKLLPAMMKMQLGIIELFVNNKDKILDVAQKTIDVLGTFIEQGLFDKLLIFAENTMSFLGKWGIPMAYAVLDLANFIVGAADVAASWTDDWFGLKHSLAEAADGLSFWTDMAEGWDSWWSKHGFANGGYVPATPGGVPAIIGEGGEGEYIIPESKMNGLGGVTIVFSGNVYGMNDFKQQVRSIMNEYTTKANFR